MLRTVSAGWDGKSCDSGRHFQIGKKGVDGAMHLMLKCCSSLRLADSTTNNERHDMSRQGKHRQGKVSIGFYVDDDFRALLVLVAKLTGETATDIMIDGVLQKARGLGIIKNGEISGEYREEIKNIKAAYLKRKEKDEEK